MAPSSFDFSTSLGTARWQHFQVLQLSQGSYVFLNSVLVSSLVSVHNLVTLRLVSFYLLMLNHFPRLVVCAGICSVSFAWVLLPWVLRYVSTVLDSGTGQKAASEVFLP